MNGVNKVILFGRLGQDPQTLLTKDGQNYARLSLATHYYLRDKDGESEKRTNWHKVNVFGKKADICAKFLKKGAAVYVEGYLSTFETEEEGKKRWHTVITANDLNFPGPS